MQLTDARAAAPSRDPDAQLTLGRRREDLGKLVGWLDTLGAQHAWSAQLLMNLNLALEEWFVNVISYAFDDAGEHAIVFRLWIDGKALRIEIEDDGKPFDPTAQAVPDIAADIEKRRVGGLGIHFIRRIMTDMSYRRQGGHNLLILTARMDAPGGGRST